MTSNGLTANELVEIYKMLGIHIHPTLNEELIGYLNPDGSYMTLKEMRLAIEKGDIHEH